jgi:hypothetical protein
MYNVWNVLKEFLKMENAGQRRVTRPRMFPPPLHPTKRGGRAIYSQQLYCNFVFGMDVKLLSISNPLDVDF